jgi:hypothetical protein
MLDEQAAVLHHLDPGRLEAPRRRVVADTELKPYDVRSLRDHVLHVLVDIRRPSEDVDDIDVTRHVDQPAINRPAATKVELDELRAGVTSVPLAAPHRPGCCLVFTKGGA